MKPWPGERAETNRWMFGDRKNPWGSVSGKKYVRRGPMSTVLGCPPKRGVTDPPDSTLLLLTAPVKASLIPASRRLSTEFSEGFGSLPRRVAPHGEACYTFSSPPIPFEPSLPPGEALAMVAIKVKTILVAEDSADTRTVLSRVLTSLGYRVVEAADGEAAVEAARKVCPDLVLMDLNMPVMDGLAATERIRQLKDECGNIPVIAVTAFDYHGIREAALEVGCVAYLLKPLALDELESVIAGLLAD